MGYTVQSGDTLWGIARKQFQLSDANEIAKKVGEIAKANNISDTNSIFAGQQFDLGNTQDIAGKEKSIIDSFDEFTNSDENYQDVINGGDGGEFAMFDTSNGLSTYSSDLRNFSQQWLDKWDDDKDGQWNKSEFIRMASNGTENITDEQMQLYEQAFSGMQLDDNQDNITTGEIMSQLYITDLDFEKYAQTNSIAQSLDGGFKYEEYQAKSSILPGMQGFETMRKEKLDFYNNFYANKPVQE